MKQEVSPEGAPVTAPHPRKSKHRAEKFEGYIGVVMVAAIAVLAVVLIYGLMQTGSDTPSWMR